MLNDESIIAEDITYSEGRRIILFSTTSQLQRLARSSTFCMDGTFKITPNPWSQVAIISAQISIDTWVPIAFALLPDKKLDTYIHFFNLLKTALTKRDLTLAAQHFMADFEVNIRKSAKSTWPDLEIHGCQFHFSKALWKRIRRNKMKPYYSDGNS